MPIERQSRYRDDEDGGGQRNPESQPEYSQDALYVDDELSASFDDSTNVPSKDFISRDNRKIHLAYLQPAIFNNSQHDKQRPRWNRFKLLHMEPGPEHGVLLH